jgi:prevent-host-death family protein
VALIQHELILEKEYFDDFDASVIHSGTPPSYASLTSMMSPDRIVTFLSTESTEEAMKTLSLSEVKMKLSALVEAVRATDEEVVITKNGAPVAVLVSLDEFESWRETIAIQSDPELMEEIRKGLAALKQGQSRLYTLEELFDG